MTTLRLLADDLTGALDTAAAFVPLVGSVPCFWHGHLPAQFPASAAIDAASRELDRATAMARHVALSGALAQGDIAFKKIDSLLRGHSFAEIAACVGTGLWKHVLIAPAFPFQGRATRGGCQFRRDAQGDWRNVADLVASLQGEGISARIGRPGAALAEGVTVFDAESDDDLQAAVRRGLAAAGAVLWCGSAGLALALVAALGKATQSAPARLRGPVLGLFGSDQDVTAQQLDNCGRFALRVADTNPAPVAARLRRDGAAMVGFTLPAGTGREKAAALIRTRLSSLIATLRKPGTLIVGGGETLRTVCDLLDAERLDVVGAFVPGVPRSIMRGGLWDGVEAISKSGAFGTPDLLRDLLHSADLDTERTAS